MMSSPNTSQASISNLLHPTQLQELAQQWLKEDTPSFDYGGYIVGDKMETAVLLCKSPGILAGVPFFEAIFKEVGCEVEWLHQEGTYLEPVCKAAMVRGKARQLLLGERVALNTIARASGIATAARRLCDIAKEQGWKGQVSGTRKTTPGFKMVEKYALLVGGVYTHRMDLSQMIMLKDNHIWSAGNITEAVRAARRAGGFTVKIEVECRSVEEALEAVVAGADICMLDNFEPEAVHSAAKVIKQKFPHVIVESSGGITEETAKDYMGPNIDMLSLSKLTQGYGAVDFSLKIQKQGHDLHNPKVKDIQSQ